MSLADDVSAVRTAAAWTAGDHLVCVRVAGADAHELLDRVSPRPLFARQGQMIHTLFLADDGRPLADVYLCCDERDYLVVAEGLPGPALVEYLRPHASGLEVELVDLSATHGFLSVDGPYSWELVAEITLPDVIGLPYLAFFHGDRLTCFRGGKTGEYGYDLLVERARLPEIRDELAAAGDRIGAREIELPAVELCMLEAGFWNVRREVRDALTPIELQLQWRVTIERTFPGSVALAERRRSNTRRVALLAAAAELPIDAEIRFEDRPCGTVLNAGPSPMRGDHLAVALLDREVSHVGLSFTCSGIAARAISSPAVNNRSLYVDTQRHTWATRDATQFPPLLRPAWS